MRKILFRGKIKRGAARGKWAVGMFDRYGDTCLIDEGINRRTDKLWYIVNPVTVGQYTGLDDINGKNVFDGDILEAKLDDESEHVTRVIVEWGDFGWQTHQPGCDPDDMTEDDIGLWEVVGNKWDNPELLKYADEDTAQYADMPVLAPAARV